jgi:adenine-specific DNA-methyltransferase
MDQPANAMNTDQLDLRTPDFVNENFAKLAALFPHCVTETAEGKAIDFDLLRQELAHAVVEGPKERYRLEWPGKREAIVAANLPTTKTLRPVRDDSVDFDNTQNLYLEGDNLEVLKLLQESYLGKIKMICIDPPYNTGNDFVYRDNFAKDTQAELLDSGQKDEYNQRLVVNPETAGRYHSDWLSMMYPRLKLARNLLTEDGVIFISIDDNEVHNLRKVCDEVFGEGNHVGTFVWQSKKGGGSDSKTVVKDHEYVICFSKSINTVKLGAVEIKGEPLDQVDEKGIYRRGRELNKWGSNSRRIDRPTMWFPIKGPNNQDVYPIRNDGEEGCWRYGKLKMKEFVDKGDIDFVCRQDGTYIAYEKIRSEDSRFKPYRTWVNDVNATSEGSIEVRELFEGKKVFDFPKPLSVLRKCISVGCSIFNDEIILDFYSGSATTAHAVMQLNAEDGGKRQYIMVQLPESTDEQSEAYKAGYPTICEIGKERIRRAGKKIVAELREQLAQKQAELAKRRQGQLAFAEDEAAAALQAEIAGLEERIAGLDIGFRVYRLDSSNMQEVYYRPQDYQQASLDLFADNLKPDRTPDDLLAQVMLDWGLPLSLGIERLAIAGKQVFRVAENSLYACFDTGIDEAFAKAVAQDQPLRVVFRDNGFKDDTAKTNVQQLLKQLSPETEMKVI